MNKPLVNSLSCGLCHTDYTSSRVPVSLPQCGHTFCKECVQKTLNDSQDPPKCLTCGKQFVVLQDGTRLSPQNNYAILDVIEELSVFGICREHDQPNEYLCVEDQQYVCVKCCIFGAHKGHESREIDEIKREYDDKIKMMEKALKSFKESSVKLNEILEREKSVTVQMIDGYFDEIEATVKQQRKEWKDKVDEMYAETITNPSGDNTLDQKIAVYKKLTPENLINIKEENIEEMMKRYDSKLLEENVGVYASDLNKLSEKLTRLFCDNPPKILTVKIPEKMCLNESVSTSGCETQA